MQPSTRTRLSPSQPRLTLTRLPPTSKKTYRRRHGKVKYTLAAYVKGSDKVGIAGVKVYLQSSRYGKTWKNLGSVRTTSSTGRVDRHFISKRPSTRYYRWVVVRGQAGMSGAPKTSRQKIIVK